MAGNNPNCGGSLCLGSSLLLFGGVGMSEKIFVLQLGRPRMTYERVAESTTTAALKDKLDALDLELLKIRPILVASSPGGGFVIYSDARELPELMK